MNALMTRPTVDETSLPAILMDQEVESPVQEGFTVDSIEKCLWTASKIALAQKNLEETSEKARYFHGLIDLWQEKTMKPHISTVGYLSELLRPFLTDRLIGVRSRSISLPGYRIGFRSTPSRVVVDEAEVAIHYLEKIYPQAIQTKKEIMKSVLKPIMATGKEIPGMSLVDGDEILYVQEDR